MTPRPTPAEDRRRLGRDVLHAALILGALALFCGGPMVGCAWFLGQMDAGLDDDVDSPPTATTER